MTDHWKEEYQKCLASPYYHYTTYFLVNGKPATTHLTEEQFNDFFKLKGFIKNDKRKKGQLAAYSNQFHHNTLKFYETNRGTKSKPEDAPEKKSDYN